MAKDAREFTIRHTRESFSADRECQYAVIRCLEVIGEVSKRLSPETLKRYSSVEWSAMARMRDMLIHSYGKVDLDDVWVTVSQDINISCRGNFVPAINNVSGTNTIAAYAVDTSGNISTTNKVSFQYVVTNQ